MELGEGGACAGTLECEGRGALSTMLPGTWRPPLNRDGGLEGMW